MGKFVIECPKCGKYAEGRKGLFAKKTVECACGNVIDIKSERLTSKVCEYCKNNVVFDQTKGDNAICPVCHQKVNTRDSLKKVVEFTCPTCNCNLNASKEETTYICPLCDTEIDIAKIVAKEKAKENGLISVIKYEGGNDVFVWKHPIEDFNYGSQLIVHESQEALFFCNGMALDLFGAGEYTLETQNIPLIKKLYDYVSDSEIFHSEVYFINLTTHMGVRWGTDSKVRLFDPASGLHVELGANGTFNIKVNNSRKLILKLVGTGSELSQGDFINATSGTVAGKFRSLIINRVKANLARAIKENNINILEIDSYIDVLSEKLRDIINETLEDYGLYITEFFINHIQTPDDDPNFVELKRQFAEKTLLVRAEEIKQAEAEAQQKRRIVEAQTEAQLKMINAQAEAEAYKVQAYAEAEEMRAKGYTYQQETARQVGMEAMKNGITGNGQGGSGVIGDVASLGVALGAMGSVIGMTKDSLTPVMNDANEMGQAIGSVVSDGWNCSCGKTGITSKFCPECGTKKPEEPAVWNCSCGKAGITSKFCPECGAKKPEEPAAWNCSCGKTGITSKFCPECGNKKGE